MQAGLLPSASGPAPSTPADTPLTPTKSPLPVGHAALFMRASMRALLNRHRFLPQACQAGLLGLTWQDEASSGSNRWPCSYIVSLHIPEQSTSSLRKVGVPRSLSESWRGRLANTRAVPPDGASGLPYATSFPTYPHHERLHDCLGRRYRGLTAWQTLRYIRTRAFASLQDWWHAADMLTVECESRTFCRVASDSLNGLTT